MTDNHLSLFRKGENCLRIERADCAAVVVDCANYYRALHEAISNARHSVFVLGWDIDSRIELLRGKDAEEAHMPVQFFDFICAKAQKNPSIQFYLNRWDYSFYLAAQREGFSKIRWSLRAPENVHYKLDSIIPVGACHHQKIVVVDDEIAFCGGMDIALGRWDYRQHHPMEENRADPGGMYEPGMHHHFGPYHDIQMLVSGPAARALAELARERWRLAAGYEAVPLRPFQSGIPACWPKSARCKFTDVTVGTALTVPYMRGVTPHRHIERLYLDMIARAERFIYMENQFFTQKAIAEALNRRLREKPELRVLLLSCYDPQGIMERKSMWHGRVHFRDILESGGVADRVALAYPISRENGREKPVRIHSKTTIVDNAWLRVGSSNINNRSMALDTECDLMIEAENNDTRAKIAAIRADLIREHTGREIAEINTLINQGGSVQLFLEDLPHSRQHLRRINDEAYRHERFARLATRIADAEKPFIPGGFTMPEGYAAVKRNILLRLLLAILVIAGLVLLWKETPLAAYAAPEKITAVLEGLRDSAWIIPAILGMFVISGIAFFPVLALIATVAVFLPPAQSLAVITAGSLMGASAGYALGHFISARLLRAFFGVSPEKIAHYAKKGGVIGIAFLRMLPIAPFTAVNYGLGMARVPFLTYLAGTGLGLLPGILAFCFLGKSLSDLWRNPAPENVLYAAGGLAGWVTVIALSHFLFRHWQKKGAMGKA